MDDDIQTQEEDLQIDIHYEDHEVVEYIDGYEKVWIYEG